jgi:hypothetical protein
MGTVNIQAIALHICHIGDQFWGELENNKKLENKTPHPLKPTLQVSS